MDPSERMWVGKSASDPSCIRTMIGDIISFRSSLPKTADLRPGSKGEVYGMRVFDLRFSLSWPWMPLGGVDIVVVVSQQGMRPLPDQGNPR